jgi:hypothetical protein
MLPLIREQRPAAYDASAARFFHAQYGDEVAQIELATLRILNGSLPPRALRLVRAWARLHAEELADNWTRAQDWSLWRRSSLCPGMKERCSESPASSR